MKMLKVPPEWADGSSWTVLSLSDAEEYASRLLSEWLEEAEPGESVELEVVEMSEEEIDALPDL